MNKRPGRELTGMELISYKHESSLISVGNDKNKCDNVCELLF